MFRHILHFLAFIVAFLFNSNTQNIQIHYLGHSAFVLQFDDISVVADYGKPNAWLEWGWDSPIYDIGDLVPDIITYSHLHEDHYDSTRIPAGVKHILKNGEELDYKDLTITAIPTCEDKFGEFNNTSYLFSYKGFNILHTGDIQGMIADIENDSIVEYFKNNYPEKIDLLIMPIEGKIKYIPQTEQIIQLLQPKIIIPCHYWSQEYLNDFTYHIKSEVLNYEIVNNNENSIILKEYVDNPHIIILKRKKL